MSRKLKKTVASALALTMMTGPAACFPALQTGIVLNAATAEQVTAVAKAADGIAGPTVDAGTYEVKAGDTFKVKLKATDNADGFNALNCWLDVDTNIFEIVKTEAGDSDNADNEDTSSFSNVTINTYTKEKAAAGVKTLIVLYSDTENLKGDEVLATVTLKVKDDVQADYYSLPFDAVADGGALGNRIVTEEGERKPIVLNPTFKGASVTVGTPAADPTKAPSADPTSETPKGDTIQIEIGEVSGKAGEKVKVPVYAKNIGDGFSALQFDYAIDGGLTVGRGIKGDFGCSWTIGSDVKAAQFLEQDGNNITKDGLIGKLEVEIPADAKDGTVYNFKISNFEGAMVDKTTGGQVKLEADRFTAASGKITVGEEGSTSASPAPATDTPKGDTIQIELGSVSGDAGTKVKVPVYAKNIGDGFSALQFDYDIDGDLRVGRGIKGDFGCSWTIGSEAKAAQFLEQDGNNITKDGLIGKLEVEIPADAKDGTVYNFKISNFEGAMVDKTTGSQVKLTADKFSAAAGRITVGEAVEETPSPVPTTVPTNKTASSEQPESKTNIAGAESALKIDAGTYEAKAGDTVKVKIKVSDTKDGFNALNAWLDVDTDVFDIVSCEAGDTDDKDNEDSLAFSNVTINKFHKEDAADNITTVLCLYSDTNNANEDMVLATIELKVKDVKDGYYALPFDAKGDGGAMANRIVTKDGDRTATVINPTFLGAVVKVGDAEAASPAPTKVPTAEPTTDPTKVPTAVPTQTPPESDTIIIKGGEISGNAGEKVKLPIYAENIGEGFSALQFDYKMDKSLHIGRGIKGDFGCSWTISGADYAAQFLEADGMNITKDGCIGKLEIAIDEDTPDGTYEFEMYNFEGSMFDAAAGKQVKLDDSKFTTVSGKIIVGEPAPTTAPTTDPSPTKSADNPTEVPTPTDPATEKPTATTAPTATSVPTAEPTSEPEGFAYDVNGDEVVNTADVIALKKYLLMVYSAKAINGDVNKDGEVNALDMMRLVKKLLE